jgi:hypothetical protein
VRTAVRYSYILLITASVIVTHEATAQAIRLDNLKEQFGKGKPFKIGGGLSANGIYYNGNGGYGRNPFSYFINGNVSLNLCGLVNLPFSFTLSDMGGDYQYPVPPNRFSVHPSYKWVTAHVGNIAMTFSPYTLNGYLFTGAGVDLEPEGPIKGSVIYGRLQKAIEYDTANHTVPAAYERYGFGTKVQFQNEKYRAGLIIFRAWDDPQSIRNQPDSLGIYPKENTVVSFNVGAKIMEQMDLTVEYATSALTQDVRAEASEGSGILGPVIDSKASTGFYNALKSQLQYTLENTILGIGYERIDPGYETLGAYFINNDLENITVNAAQPLFKGKVQVAVNVGYQRDNLDGNKSGSTSRAIASANVSYTPSEKISTTFNYSNFQTFMRIRPQFRVINQLDNFQNMDTLDYTQVSQNVNASMIYTLQQTKELARTVTFDLSFQETADKQGGVVRMGNGSQFYNASVMYSTLQIPRGYNFSGAFNITYNTIGRNDFITLGPTLGFNTKLFKQKMSAGTSVSYNASKNENSWEGSVLNIRANALYKVLKSHTLNLMILNQLRRSPERPTTNDTTITIGYNFIFG